MFISLGSTPFALPAPVFLVGCFDSTGKPNIMTAAWGGLCCSQPPCLAVSLRRGRHSFAPIMERKAFTVSIPSCAQAPQADFAGLISGKETDKFAALDLTPCTGEHVDAPYVQECPVVLELRLAQHLELGSHVQLVGEIMDVKIRDDCLDERQIPRLERIDPLLFVPLAREYWGPGRMVAKAFSVGHSAGRQAVR